MQSQDAADPLDEAVLAARLFLLAPRLFGGMVLRGSSPAREALVAALGEHIALRRMPGHVDDERLLGGIDLAASLAAGAPVRQSGLIEEASGGALITGMAGDSVILQAGEQRWRLSLSALADLWRGEFATLWRTPPGHSGRLVDGLEGPAALWLGERIASLQAQGRVPASASGLDARVKAFQRSQGVDAAGVAGPVTFMQVNLASGVDEPRLFAPKP